MIKKIKFIFDFFLPRLCISCNKTLLRYEKIICSDCKPCLEQVSTSLLDHEFQRKFSNELFITDFASAFVFRNNSIIQKMIHSLKYDKNFNVGNYLGSKTANIFITRIMNWEVDSIIPIPLHNIKKIERGFNQSNEIAKGVAKIINKPIKNNVVKRNKNTESQTKFSILERKVNIKDAFAIKNSKEINGKNILLIDDVITTGATILECAKILKENGSSNIYALSVAIAE